MSPADADVLSAQRVADARARPRRRPDLAPSPRRPVVGAGARGREQDERDGDDEAIEHATPGTKVSGRHGNVSQGDAVASSMRGVHSWARPFDIRGADIPVCLAVYSDTRTGPAADPMAGRNACPVTLR